ncbi:hypothetical protein [Mucilaginibacter sp.]
MSSTAVNPINIPLASIYGEEADLQAENKVYLAGQIIFSEQPDGTVGQKVGKWKYLTQAESAAPTYNQLPWFISPDQSGAARVNLIKVRDTDDSYAVVGGNTVITDSRLVGKADYIVGTTQFNVIWDNNVLTYDAVAGTVTIAGFTLDDGKIIYIILPGGMEQDVDYASIMARLTVLETLAAPFSGNGGGKVWWTKPIAQIPAGWRECVAMQGYFPMHVLPGDADFGGAIGIPGGSKTLPPLTMANLPSAGIPFQIRKGNLYAAGGNSGAVQLIGNNLTIGASDEVVSTVTTPNIGLGQAIKSIPKFMAGIWIEPILTS